VATLTNPVNLASLPVRIAAVPDRVTLPETTMVLVCGDGPLSIYTSNVVPATALGMTATIVAADGTLRSKGPASVPLLINLPLQNCAAVGFAAAFVRVNTDTLTPSILAGIDAITNGVDISNHN